MSSSSSTLTGSWNSSTRPRRLSRVSIKSSSRNPRSRISEPALFLASPSLPSSCFSRDRLSKERCDDVFLLVGELECFCFFFLSGRASGVFLDFLISSSFDTSFFVFFVLSKKKSREEFFVCVTRKTTPLANCIRLNSIYQSRRRAVTRQSRDDHHGTHHEHRGLVLPHHHQRARRRGAFEERKGGEEEEGDLF